VDFSNLVNCYKLIRENIIASTNSISNQERPNAMKQGTLQLVSPDGKLLGTYQFRNGGGGRGYIPAGNYVVGPEEPLTNDERRAMTVGRSGWKFRIFNASGGREIADPRVEHIPTSSNPQGGPRDGILIHPDGGNVGTNGCIGIVGDERTQEDFRNKLNTLIQQSGGKYTLNFDSGGSAKQAEPSTQPPASPEAATTTSKPQVAQNVEPKAVQPVSTQSPQTSNKINTYKQFVQTRKQLSGRGY